MGMVIEKKLRGFKLKLISSSDPGTLGNSE